MTAHGPGVGNDCQRKEEDWKNAFSWEGAGRGLNMNRTLRQCLPEYLNLVFGNLVAVEVNKRQIGQPRQRCEVARQMRHRP